MQIVNWDIISHPINWVTVVLMVLIAGIAFHFFASYQTGANPFSGLTQSKSKS